MASLPVSAGWALLIGVALATVAISVEAVTNDMEDGELFFTDYHCFVSRMHLHDITFYVEISRPIAILYS